MLTRRELIQSSAVGLVALVVPGVIKALPKPDPPITATEVLESQRRFGEAVRRERSSNSRQRSNPPWLRAGPAEWWPGEWWQRRTGESRRGFDYEHIYLRQHVQYLGMRRSEPQSDLYVAHMVDRAHMRFIAEVYEHMRESITQKLIKERLRRIGVV